MRAVWWDVIGTAVLTALAAGVVVLVGCGCVALVRATSRYWSGR